MEEPRPTIPHQLNSSQVLFRFLFRIVLLSAFATFGTQGVKSDGAETGGAEPHIAEQSRSWRAASGEREVMRGS